MENREDRYVEYVENNIANRNNIITHSLYNKTEKSTSLSQKESYRSYYMFDKSLFDHVKKYSSVKFIKSFKARKIYKKKFNKFNTFACI